MTEYQGHCFTTNQHPACFSVCFLQSCVSVCFTASVCFGRGLKLQPFDPVTEALGSEDQLWDFCVQPRGTFFFSSLQEPAQTLQNLGCRKALPASFPLLLPLQPGTKYVTIMHTSAEQETRWVTCECLVFFFLQTELCRTENTPQHN